MTVHLPARLSDYGFVITILWIGFVLAISFLETPLRFSAESVSVPVALQIGRLVFHALNCCEWLFAVIVLVKLVWSRASRRSRCWYGIAVMILVAQTLILFLVLDARTEAVIQNREVGESPFHTIYIGLEVAKLIALSMLAKYQITDFKNDFARRD